MNLEHLSNELLSKANQNFENLNQYYNHNLFELIDLQSIIYENLNCLLLELNQSSIFTTNHLFERLLKLVLIKKYTLGIDYSNPELYNKKVNEAVRIYDAINLNQSIDKITDLNIICKTKSQDLKELKNKFRNPFSHAETAKINSNAPDYHIGFMFDIQEIQNKLISNQEINLPEPTYISTKSPSIAQLLQFDRSKNDALYYFDKIFKLIIELENYFIEIKNVTTSVKSASEFHLIGF